MTNPSLWKFPPEAGAPRAVDLHFYSPAPFSAPPPNDPLADNDIDTTITAPRFDDNDGGKTENATPKGTNLGPRQRRFEFDAKVIRDSIVRKFRSIGRDDLADPIDDCHRDAVFKRCCGCRHVRTFYNRCERFYCPICAARLARDRREGVQWWSKCINQPKHIVLTVTSVPVLTKQYIRELKNDFRRLRTQEWAKDGIDQPFACIVPWARDLPFTHWRAALPKWLCIRIEDGIIYRRTTKWRGGFWSIDATFHKDVEPGQRYTCNGHTETAVEAIPRGWHIHFHILADADFIDSETLEQKWCKLRGQKMAIVRVFNVRGRDYTAEVCRYVTDGVQLGNWPAEKLAEFGDALRKERCFDTFGALYKQRAEWTEFKEEMHADRNKCQCGCTRFEFFDDQEWEWQQCKNDLPPPQRPAVSALALAPELFPILPGIVK